MIRGEELSSSAKTSINNEIARSYPNATRLRTATTNYNCHSYAWYSTSTSNKHWMNNPSRYMSDGSYSFAGNNATANNQKIFWGDGSHSGVVYSKASNVTQTVATSKWGQAGLYRHRVFESPYYPGPIVLKFYK